MSKKLLVLVLYIFLGITGSVAQISTLQGTVVTDEDGEPVIGASVVIKGTTRGTVTNVSGAFTLQNVPTSAKLVVSYIGLITQEVAVKSGITIRLKVDNHQLDEVVVTALGISREKKALGYSAQEI